MKITAIIAAAGSGTRMGADKNKVLLTAGGKPVLWHTLAAFSCCGKIDEIILVTRKCDMPECAKLAKQFAKPITVISGGKTRQESVFLGLKAAQGSDIAVIHDGARVLVTVQIIESTIADAAKYGAAAAGVPSKDSLKKVSADGFITATIDRESAYQIQTPQVFDYQSILSAHQSAEKDGFSATDDCALYEKYIGRIKVTPGSYENIKLTTPGDMLFAEEILNKKEN